MHDWHLANQVLKTVLDYGKKNGFKKITKIEIKLGDILEHGEYISSENLIHNLGILFKKTIAKNAEVKVKKRKGDDWKLISLVGDR